MNSRTSSSEGRPSQRPQKQPSGEERDAHMRERVKWIAGFVLVGALVLLLDPFRLFAPDTRDVSPTIAGMMLMAALLLLGVSGFERWIGSR